jgi:lysophospholipase L1-like esterase
VNACALTAAAVITLFGDSNTMGPVAGPESEPGWAELLAESSPKCEVVNWGLAGATAREWATWVVWFDVHVPGGWVVLQLGTNDARDIRQPAATPGEYGRRMSFLAGWFLTHGAEGVLLTIPPPNNLPANDPSHALLAEYRERLLDICSDSPMVKCGPDLLEVIDPEDDLLDDGIHFDTSGQFRVFAEVYWALHGWQRGFGRQGMGRDGVATGAPAGR